MKRYCFYLAYLILPISLMFGQQTVDPDSIPLSKLAVGDYNPHGSLYSMNSWTMPVLDHEGRPHKDGHIIQIIADGGNGVQDPPNPDGSPGGDDTLADGNFNIQFVNGEKHKLDGLDPGMFMGMCYFIPYKLDRAIYLRLWEGTGPSVADYYQDSEEYTTYLRNRGGAIIVLQEDALDNIDWRFGASKKMPRNR